MLACLPGPGDLSLQLLSHTQMNTGLQKWDTTQKMRSAQYPTPAELDAYAKKVANNPLTIKIFPNSVKVPQRNHVRRTVNGLDTSSARYSPYPCQASGKAGLLAIVKLPTKGVVKDFDGSRARLLPEVIMSHPGAPSYSVASTLNLPHSRPQALAQQGLPHPQTIQQQQQQHGLRPPLTLPRPHPPLTLTHAPSDLLLQQQGAPPPLHGVRKMAEGDAPPNVTVSTSTIPLSMAASLQQSRPADLSSIVHQINQFCQARAGVNSTSVCEGQIANPSPISRNLLINASSRVSMHNPPSCVLGSTDKPPPANMAAINRIPIYPPDVKQQQQLRSWNQQHQPPPPLSHLHLPEGNQPPKHPPSFPCKTLSYPPELCMGQPYSMKPLADKPTPSPPVNGLPGPPPSTAYTNGHYFQPVWNSILPTPNSDSSGSQDLPGTFHGGPSVDCAPVGGHYRAGGISSGQTNLMQTVDYLGADFQPPCFRDQNLVLMVGKGHRPPTGRVPEPSDCRNSHIQHPGYR